MEIYFQMAWLRWTRETESPKKYLVQVIERNITFLQNMDLKMATKTSNIYFLWQIIVLQKLLFYISKFYTRPTPQRKASLKKLRPFLRLFLGTGRNIFLEIIFLWGGGWLPDILDIMSAGWKTFLDTTASTSHVTCLQIAKHVESPLFTKGDGGVVTGLAGKMRKDGNKC